MSDLQSRLFIDGPVGQLEALLELPDDAARGVAVLCHPHPLHGGSLTNKVVHTLANGLRDLQRITVRFNFRGVGGSEGEYAEGIGEQDDLRAVLQWVRENYPDQPLWLGGFSFGAYIALAACEGDIEQLITIAPPVNFFDFSHLSQPTCPWLLIQGEADELVPVDQVRQWLGDSQLQPAASIYLPEVEHFFHGKLNLLKQVLQDNLPAA